MPGTSQFDTSAAFSELNLACTVQAYDKVISLATKILNKKPSEYKALQCKAVALIRTEKYDECLSTLRKFPDLAKYAIDFFSSNFRHVLFERAYTEYRLNRINEALKTLNEAESEDLRILELKAQVHYRREEFTEAQKCLRKVIRNSQDDYGEERLTNLAAVAAAATCFSDECLDLDVASDLYEGKFNVACYHLGKGDQKLAQRFLEEAEDACRTVLSEDPEVTEEEINEELVPVRIQQAYLLQKQNKEDVANQTYQSVVRIRSADPALLAVAANNIVCINKEQNIFDSRKRIKAASVDGLQHKLFARQREQILINQGLFYWHTNQVDACHAKVRDVLQQNPHSVRALLLHVTQLLKEKQLDRAIKVIQDQCNPDDIVLDERSSNELRLTLGQLLLRASKTAPPSVIGLPRPEQAIAVTDYLIHSLSPSLLYTPGVVSTCVALFLIASGADETDKLNRDETLNQAVQLIQSALNWFETNNQSEPTYANLLLDQCANFLLQHGKPALAADLCERQLARLDRDFNPNDERKSAARMALIGRLVRAYAQFDRPKAEASCRSLEFTDRITEADVDSLESAFLYGVKAVRRQGRTGDQTVLGDTKSASKSRRNLVATPAPGSTDGASAAEVEKRKRRHKKRPLRLPKNYQPGVIPDPDRWLPRRERAGYRGKRRNKRQINLRGPQGQVSGGAEWDATVKSPKPAVTTSPLAEAATGSTPKQAGGTSRQQQQRKGRKKGR
ncbi:Signal recognition particle subunit SRP72 [Fasciola hepatica]|uniref:Signal recognition particle subunit SRP72 n=1 Tax=Fasciola hepatica TaxID=6192 RepID=A0A4E0RYR6_FASHE|nr:Signal recognition particle subunit SRP72 [Fasciola hepatica]